jgi:hypothetical protein
MRSQKGLTILGASLNKALRRAEIDQKMKEALCLEYWEEIVGETNARATRADSIKEGVLFVSVKSSAWAQELSFLKPEIIKKLNDRVGKKIVKEIQFKTRTLKKKAPTQEDLSEPQPKDVTLSADEMVSLEQEVSHLNDDKLRETMLRLLISQYKVQKLKQASGWIPCPRCHTLHTPTETLCPICRMETK